MHFSQQEIRNNCFSKKTLSQFLLSPHSCSFLSLVQQREREGERGGGANASFPRRRQGGFNPCPSTKVKGSNLIPHLARLDIIEYVMEMVTNSSIRRVQAFLTGLQEGGTRHRRSIRGIHLGRSPLQTYCNNIENMFVVRTRGQFLYFC